MISQSIAVLLNIVLNYFLVKTQGIIGAGIATFASYLVAAILCNYYARMNFDVAYTLRLLRVGIAASIMGLLFRLYGMFSFPQLIINAVLALVSYTISIFLFGVISFKDIRRKMAL